MTLRGLARRGLLVLADTATLVVIPIALSIVRFGADWRTAWQGMLPAPWFFLALYASEWLFMLWAQGLYRTRSRWTIGSEVRAVAQAMFAAIVVTFVVLYLLHLAGVSRLLLLVLFPVQAAAIVVARQPVHRLARALHRFGGQPSNVLVLGTAREGQVFADQLEHHPELALRVVGCVGEPPQEPIRWPYLGPLESLERVVHEQVVDELAFCLPYEQWGRFEAILALCTVEGKLLRVPLELPQLWRSTGHLESLDETPVLTLGGRPDRVIGLRLKRLLDIIGSAAGLLILSPLLAVVAVAIYLDDGRPALFRQTRVGLQGRRFQIVKFRTMSRGADAQRAELRARNEVRGAAFKMTNDPRITRLGRWLRRTSIDELPQLWNVLRGDMSLVGPRPHPLDDVAGYNAWHRRRLSMKPGITGLWQVRGRREPDFDRWVQQDLDYIDGWSLWLDLRLLLSTIPAVLRSEGR
ncbi:MAG TPA: sugar transferase [Candidatus Limnocylindrales bacterium]